MRGYNSFRLLSVPMLACVQQKQRDASGTEVLSRLDKLYIVHVVKESKKDREGDKWCVGGPLLPPMRVALAKFPHQVTELEVSGKDHLWVTAELAALILGRLHACSAWYIHAGALRQCMHAHAVLADTQSSSAEWAVMGGVQGQSVHSTLLDFAQREGIDIMILGEALLPPKMPRQPSGIRRLCL